MTYEQMAGELVSHGFVLSGGGVWYNPDKEPASFDDSLKDICRNHAGVISKRATDIMLAGGSWWISTTEQPNGGLSIVIHQQSTDRVNIKQVKWPRLHSLELLGREA